MTGRLAGSLSENLTEAQMKYQVINGLPSNLHKISLLAQSLPFDAMMNTIERKLSMRARKKTGKVLTGSIEVGNTHSSWIRRPPRS